MVTVTTVTDPTRTIVTVVSSSSSWLQVDVESSWLPVDVESSAGMEHERNQTM